MTAGTDSKKKVADQDDAAKHSKHPGTTVVDAEKQAEFNQVVASLRGVNSEVERANALVKEFDALMRRSVELQDKLKVISIKASKEVKGIRAKAKALKLGDSQVADDLSGAIRTLARRSHRLRETQPETGSFFSRLVLGRVNVKCFSDRERVRLRDEYNKFKVRANIIFILFPVVVLYAYFYLREAWLDTHWINVFHHVWLLYYFVSLALRENILLVNGSNIRPWWIYHHYLSAFATVIWLAWPPTDLYMSYIPYITGLCLYTGLVQAMQILFYRKRDYANRALGKTGHMDISYPETITELPKELLILVPFLLSVHTIQIFVGLSFAKTFLFETDVFGKHWTEYREELQLAAMALLTLFVGGGNFISTVQTVISKANKNRSLRERAEAREQLSRVLEFELGKPKAQ
mmetsp:Transcript_9580/g.16816  ORF Transcript_9580/g.16816 Transcript_9580/m.16816 type:complete len:406 (-) Transcript_9580:238-1455(-)|eukprot:CAMPEP_0184525856 /NCGR_PEP_ID=MMETSP0198_2-20121128/10337_1 /TAXON_ID=1112570 /ORGANISM="Thraustochytrium sp., Strain LLF1b" /LENGTH=405 /DNA_ID=CAMNT_0026917375 /DNA_START=280 /DNA_END=1497 /DNA_ORIENTATION=+